MRKVLSIMLLLVLEASAATPPRPRLARCLSSERIATVVSNAPASAKISIPMSARREWSAAACPADRKEIQKALHHKHEKQRGKPAQKTKDKKHER